MNKGLALHPKVALSKNIGFDGTGEHCNENTFFDVDLSDQFSEKQPNQLNIDLPAYEQIRQYFITLHKQRYSLSRIIKKIRDKIV